jgi:hypothetical protein
MKSLSLTLLLALIISSAYANEDFELDDSSVENSQMDISGNYEKPKSRAEMMASRRRKEEKRTEMMVRKQIERTRYKRELKMRKEINHALGQQLQQLNNIN